MKPSRASLPHDSRILWQALWMPATVSFAIVGYAAILASGFYTGIEREIEESERLTMKEYEEVMAGLERIASRLEALERRLGSS